MCGRYTVARIDHLLTAFPRYRFPSDAVPRYNVAPTQAVLALRNDGTDAVEWLRWGIEPPPDRSGALRPALINARLETLAERSMWRGPLRTRRCAIFADGFYEWQPAGKEKRPFYLRLRGGAPFAFAGLWDRHFPHGHAPEDRCAIVTGRPNALAATVHDRMPVILRPEAIDRWLDPGEHEVPALLELLDTYPAEEMELFEVSRLVNSAANDEAQLIEPLKNGEPSGGELRLF
jgi:putative SOS response-associated peptidase YedK